MIVFACGLSKCGKTTTLLATKFPANEVRHVKASDLLRSRNRPTKNLRATDVIPNQSVLVESVLENLAKKPGLVILDGHLLIETIDGPQLVPERYLDPMPIVGVIVIESTPQDVVKHREKFSLALSVDEAANLMDLESIQAHRFARHRSVDFSVIKSGDTGAVREFVRRLAQV